VENAEFHLIFTFKGVMLRKAHSGLLAEGFPSSCPRDAYLFPPAPQDNPHSKKILIYPIVDGK